LIATIRSRRVSRALYTSPIPPSPRADSSSCGPSLSPADRGITIHIDYRKNPNLTFRSDLTELIVDDSYKSFKGRVDIANIGAAAPNRRSRLIDRATVVQRLRTFNLGAVSAPPGLIKFGHHWSEVALGETWVISPKAVSGQCTSQRPYSGGQVHATPSRRINPVTITSRIRALFVNLIALWFRR
jgi:hypothetical protein